MIGLGEPESILIKQPTAPTANATVTLFDSAVMFWKHCLRPMKATMLTVTFEVLSQDSATNGLIAYTSTDGGTTYTQNNMKDASGSDTLPIQVTSAGIPRTFTFLLAPFDDFKLTYTAGATPPLSTWRLHIALHCGNPSVSY